MRASGRAAGWHRNAALGTLGLALCVVSVLYLLRPTEDTDFFWHLKTGEWISGHGSLPVADPFSYTSPAVTTTGVRFTLTSYWASQLLYYHVHALGGWVAIVVLRFLLAAALLLAVWRRRQGDVVVDAALLVVFAVVVLEQFSLERPQFLSFLGFCLLLHLLEGTKRAPEGRRLPGGGLRRPLLVALLMVVWANVHGGHALGQATILVYLAAEGAKYAHPSLRPAHRGTYRLLLVAGGAGLAASLLNPNTYHALEIALADVPSYGAEGMALKLKEYLSLPEAIRANRDYIRFVDLGLMAVVLAAVAWRPKQFDLTEAVLAAGTACFAFQRARYLPFFMIVALPIAGRFLSQGARPRWAGSAAAAFACALAVTFGKDERGGLERLRTGEWVDRLHLPVDAADFIVARNLRGNMYNPYAWGGYLIWRLAPERRVFADGRNLKPEVAWEGAMIDHLFEVAGQPAWKPLFEKYDIAYAVLPFRQRGKVVPLVNSVFLDPGWVAVFIGENSVIFSRKPTGRPRVEETR